MTRLLLLSNSTNFGGGYLDHAMPAVLAFLGPVRSLLFVPFALMDRVAYTERARTRFAREGINVVGLDDGADAAERVRLAEAVFVGGGNTFRLLARLQAARLIEPLRQRALGGMPFMGASAGTNIAAPTIKTTNDMPIVQPASFDALGLVPFQINPHYVDADPSSKHMGETREERLKEFLEENDRAVVGLREGAWLGVDGTSVRLDGAGARIFRRGHEPRDASPGESLEPLLSADRSTGSR